MDPDKNFLGDSSKVFENVVINQLSVCNEYQTEPISGISTIPPSPLEADFRIDKSNMMCIPTEQQAVELKDLNICAYDQVSFENEVMQQVDQAFKKEEKERQKKTAEKEMKGLAEDILTTKQQLKRLDRALIDCVAKGKVQSREQLSIKRTHDLKLKQLQKLEAKERRLNAYLAGKQPFQSPELDDADNVQDETSSNFEIFQPEETETERLIRTGQMTPFGTVLSHPASTSRQSATETAKTDFDEFLLSQDEIVKVRKKVRKPPERQTSSSTDDLITGMLIESDKGDLEAQQPGPSHIPPTSLLSNFVHKPPKHRPKKMKLGTKYANGMAKRLCKQSKLTHNFNSDIEMSDIENGDLSPDEKYSDEDYVPDAILSESDEDFNDEGTGIEVVEKTGSKKTKPVKNTNALKKIASKKQSRIIDDGLADAYAKRIKLYQKEKLLQKHKKILESEDGVVESDDEEYVEFDGNFKVPSTIWNKLYSYQQTCVRWLWELHNQNCGGVLGDEMGLGKTIEVIAFLISLKVSNVCTDGDEYQGLGPIMLVCPTTVMHQWVKEFHTWWPLFRVAVLHESGSFRGKKDQLVKNVNQRHGIIITSYNGLVQYQESLLSHEWHYIILDEGHKIRNPDAQATLVAKQFRTAHRLILSGSPVQNNLKELWSLFDFVFPGKLGTLPIFMQQFSVPIVQGGYANASQVQVQTAYKCATVLRDSIKPYLLRRMKADVKMSINLPNKNEQVLFCKLTEEQTELYKGYISSSEVQSILNARLKVFVGLINLRKICNHPDLYTGGPKIFKHTDVSCLPDEERYGFFKRSGKMIVVEALLKLWHKQSHRVLLFTQSRQMMEIFEIFVKKEKYTYMRMDGSTSVAARQPAIAKFNDDPNIFVFLLTTRVGGIGVNLTGANRIIIYDPDWNPSTDAQARERSWRIGQERQVTIYRLLTAGTIEEKIYHRQIFKQFVTNRVLKDPRQRRFFKSNDLYELFTFTDTTKHGTETSAIFAGTGSEIRPVLAPKCPPKKTDEKTKGFWETTTETDIKSTFTQAKIESMKDLAKRLSLQLSQGKASSETNSVSQEKSSKDSSTNDVSKNSEASMDRKKTETNTQKSSNSHVQKKNKRQKHNRKKTRPTVDGEQIDYLVKKAQYKAAEEEKEDDTARDDYVLSKLFKNSGVHTALKHDVIVDASDPDYMLVEGEANRVAQDAIRALKQSRRQCAQAADGVPTWTGSNGGTKPKFGAKKKLPMMTNTNKASTDLSIPSTSGFKPKKSSSSSGVSNLPHENDNNHAVQSSADLLSTIRQRKRHYGTTNDAEDSDSDTEPTATSTNSEYDELLVEIWNFIAFRASVDGQAATDELLNEFKDKLPTQHTAVFRSLLNKICDFSRRGTGDGVWYLKEEFR